MKSSILSRAQVSQVVYSSERIKQAVYLVAGLEFFRTITVAIINSVWFTYLQTSDRQQVLIPYVTGMAGTILLLVTISFLVAGVRCSSACMCMPHMIAQGFVVGFYCYFFGHNIYMNQYYASSIWYEILFDLVVVLTEIWFFVIVSKFYTVIRATPLVRSQCVIETPIQQKRNDENFHSKQISPQPLSSLSLIDNRTLSV